MFSSDSGLSQDPPGSSQVSSIISDSQGFGERSPRSSDVASLKSQIQDAVYRGIYGNRGGERSPRSSDVASLKSQIQDAVDRGIRNEGYEFFEWFTNFINSLKKEIREQYPQLATEPLLSPNPGRPAEPQPSRRQHSLLKEEDDDVVGDSVDSELRARKRPKTVLEQYTEFLVPPNCDRH
jgi:hypothetical protein